MGLAAAIVVMLYRRRGFLAAWIAGMASGWLTTAMALRSLEDQDLSRASNVLVALVVGIAAAGAWGAGRRLIAESRRYIRARSSVSIAVRNSSVVRYG